MIKFFRKIRKQLMTENKFSKYLLYALGEIILVVIGILIALTINNHNEVSKTRAKELNYLKGIKADLHLNLSEIEAYLKTRKTTVHSAEAMLGFYENKVAVHPDSFVLHNLNVQIQFPFHKNNNTYLELINSGNLAIISNNTIKDLLLNMDAEYKKIEFIQDHLRHDYEHYLYPNYFNTSDLKSDVDNYTYQVSKGAAGAKTKLSKEKVELLLNNQTLKNGFVLTIFNNNLLIISYNNMLLMTEELIEAIDLELKSNE